MVGADAAFAEFYGHVRSCQAPAIQELVASEVSLELSSQERSDFL